MADVGLEFERVTLIKALTTRTRIAHARIKYNKYIHTDIFQFRAWSGRDRAIHGCEGANQCRAQYCLSTRAATVGARVGVFECTHVCGHTVRNIPTVAYTSARQWAFRLEIIYVTLKCNAHTHTLLMTWRCLLLPGPPAYQHVRYVCVYVCACI